MNKQVATNQKLLDELIYYYATDSGAEHPLSEEAKDYMQLLENALGQLTPQRRRIYELCKKEKKSYMEVAKELGISPNTVKNHMVQILNSLRMHFRRQEMHAWIVFVLLNDLF